MADTTEGRDCAWEDDCPSGEKWSMSEETEEGFKNTMWVVFAVAGTLMLVPCLYVALNGDAARRWWRGKMDTPERQAKHEALEQDRRNRSGDQAYGSVV